MDITSLLGNVMDKDMLETISKSTKTSSKNVSDVLKNAAPSLMKHLDGDSDIAKAVKKLLGSEDVEKIAKKVGISGDSVKEILNKAVPMLKDLLSKQGDNMSDLLGGIAGKLFKQFRDSIKNIRCNLHRIFFIESLFRMLCRRSQARPRSCGQPFP